jgi:hypothetical protein
MKLSTVSTLSAIAVFVATLPHGVGAWLIKVNTLKPVTVSMGKTETVLRTNGEHLPNCGVKNLLGTGKPRTLTRVLMVSLKY